MRLCEDCQFWEALRKDKGQCRRYPPRFDPYPEADATGIWPTTRAEDWCGEFVELRFDDEEDDKPNQSGGASGTTSSAA
jgi:hypothetical protein